MSNLRQVSTVCFSRHIPGNIRGWPARLALRNVKRLQVIWCPTLKGWQLHVRRLPGSVRGFQSLSTLLAFVGRGWRFPKQWRPGRRRLRAIRGGLHRIEARFLFQNPG